MQYELWEYDGGHTLFEATADEAARLERIRQLQRQEPEARHTTTIEAGSWNEAMQKLYDRKGWGRYRTLEEELGESPDPAAPSENGASN